MRLAPFPEDQELYEGLHITSAGTLERHTTGPVLPQTSVRSSLPGHPNIDLYDPGLAAFLGSELIPGKLNRLAPHLWLVAKQDSAHVSPLTHQLVRGRRIVITENPNLHLVWISDQIFIKPLPKYLLSSAFWEYCFGPKTSPIQDKSRRTELHQAALGFLRTYCFLIQHKSDFRLATDPRHTLLPRKIKYGELVCCLSSCRQYTSDADVCSRFHYGELRLSRINFWSKIFLRQITFHNVHGQYAARFAQYYAPILFVFAGLSVILSAMQVAVAAQPVPRDVRSKSDDVLGLVSWGFSICALVIAALVMMFICAVFLTLSLRETIYALKDLVRKRKLRGKGL